MAWLLIVSIVVMTIPIIKGRIWEKLYGLSSIGVKIVVLMALLAMERSLPFLMDVSLMYSMISGAGMILLIVFLMRGGVE